MPAAPTLPWSKFTTSSGCLCAGARADSGRTRLAAPLSRHTRFAIEVSAPTSTIRTSPSPTASMRYSLPNRKSSIPRQHPICSMILDNACNWRKAATRSSFLMILRVARWSGMSCSVGNTCFVCGICCSAPYAPTLASHDQHIPIIDSRLEWVEGSTHTYLRTRVAALGQASDCRMALSFLFFGETRAGGGLC